MLISILKIITSFNISFSYKKSKKLSLNRKQEHEQYVFLFTFYIYVQIFSSLEAIIKSYIYFTKCVYIHALNTF